MNLERYRIDDWLEDTLLGLPDEETDFYEYKSSKTEMKELKKKISIAASAFWNTGGGIFIAGVDDNGKVDGGLCETIGKQKLRDWVDQVLAAVEPLGPYTMKIITPKNANSSIRQQHAVLVLAFDESPLAPHMAMDKKYYIRTGAHSSPASHFLVEAIRARRGLRQPLLRGILRFHEQRRHIVELVILALNEAAALDVYLNFEPLPKLLAKNWSDKFPLHIPAIDQTHPFTMDISTFPQSQIVFGDKPVQLKLTYKDVAGRIYEDSQILDPEANLAPVRGGQEVSEEILNALQDMSKHLKQIVHSLPSKSDGSAV